VELWQPARPRPEQDENVELAVSLAATVVAEVCRKGGSNLLFAVTEDAPACSAGPASLPLMEETMTRLALVKPSDRDRLPALLALALPRIDRNTDIVLVSTREADPTDRRRFAALWNDPSCRAAMARIRHINTGSSELAEIFQ
jgi:hypothetical protein